MNEGVALGMKKLLVAVTAALSVWSGMSVEAADANSEADFAAQDAASTEYTAYTENREEPQVVGGIQFNPEPIEGKVFQLATTYTSQYTQDYRLAKYDTFYLKSVGFQSDVGGDTYVIAADGTVQFPYVGTVKLSGLTMAEAQQVAKEAFGHYLREPDIALVMKSFANRTVYVMGEVNRPGVQNMRVDTLNAYAAVANAGGPTSHGMLSRSMVMRVVDGQLYYKNLDLNRFIKKHDFTQNVALEDGDIVYVARTNGIKWQQDVMPYISAISSIYAVKKIFE